MKKLKQGDLCKIWIDDRPEYDLGIFIKHEESKLVFDAIQSCLLYRKPKDGYFHTEMRVPIRTKVTVWKQSSFEKQTIKYGFVVRNGEFVDRGIVIKELSRSLSSYFSIYACRKFLNKLKQIRKQYEKTTN